MIGLGNLHGLKPKKIWQTGLNCKKGIINVNNDDNYMRIFLISLIMDKEINVDTVM